MVRLLADLRHGLRLVKKAPGASLLAMLALGLGVGANTAIFSVANGILLHPLPYAQQERLVFAGEVPPHRPATTANPLSGYTLTSWEQQAHSFDAMAAFHYVRVNLSGAGMPATVQGAEVSANFFNVLPSRALRGRTFVAGEDQPGREREVVLSQALWEHQFAANPGTVGSTIQLDQKAYTVVGIVGKDAVMPQSAELWVPMALTPEQRADRGNHYIRFVGHLRAGTTLAGAQAELAAIAARNDAVHPDTNRGWGVYAEPLANRVIGGDETPSYIFLLMGAVGFLLVIACANVANLQFARALGRNHELAIRTALGAGRGRLVGQLLGENVVLGVGGAVVGAGFAWIAIHLILSSMPADVAVFVGGWDRIRLDGTALAFTLGVAILAGVLAGLAPAWHASRPDLNATLKEAGRGAIGHSRRRLRSALVILQVALALVLLIGAGLMVEGFRALLDVGNYQPEGVLTAAILLPEQRYPTPTSQAQFFDQVLGRAAALPGVTAAATGSFVPLGQNLNITRLGIQGQPPAADASQAQYAVPQSVSPDFLTMLHIPLLAGRGIAAGDGASNQPVALVSANLARRYWPQGDAIGHMVQLGTGAAASPWLRVVGIVGDVKWAWGDKNVEYTVYRPAEQAPDSNPYLLVRAAAGGDVTRFGPALRRMVTEVDRNQPLGEVKSLAELIHESSIGIAYVAVMMTVAAALALVLAAIGVYGVMALLVGERTREFGIRRALGASQGSLVGLVLRRGLVMLGWGLAAGLPVAYLLARGLQSLILGISAGDVATYAAISLLLAAMVTVACYLPARRAARVDPLVALRE